MWRILSLRPWKWQNLASMRVLLDGRRLTRARQRGGLDAAWRLLVPTLLGQAPQDFEFGLLTTSAYPWRTGMLPGLAAQGASIHHHWASASVIATLGRLGVRTEWLGPGKADLHSARLRSDAAAFARCWRVVHAHACCR